MTTRQTVRWLVAALMSTFALTSGAQDIIVGQIGPFTGLPSPDAHEVRDGAQAYFAAVNKGGGVRGRKLSLFTLDDEFKGDVFIKRFDEAMQRRPVALLSPIGSAAMSSLLKSKLLDSADIVVVNAIPGAEAFRQPGDPKLFHVRAGDKAQLDKILLHCKTLNVVNLHVVRQDLPIGESGLSVVRESAQMMGGLTISASIASNSAESLHEAAKKVVAAAPQGVIVIGAPKFMAGGCGRKPGLVRRPAPEIGGAPWG